MQCQYGKEGEQCAGRDPTNGQAVELRCDPGQRLRCEIPDPNELYGYCAKEGPSEVAAATGKFFGEFPYYNWLSEDYDQEELTAAMMGHFKEMSYGEYERYYDQLVEQFSREEVDTVPRTIARLFGENRDAV